MKLSKATILLKAVLAVSAVLLGLVIFGGVPAYMQHVIHVKPELAVWDYWMRAYATLLALPVWAVMVLLWRTFDTIPKNAPFCVENARRFFRIAQLAAADLVLVLALWMFLYFGGALPAFIAVWLLCATYVGIVAAIVFYVLGGLVRKAAELKQDNDMTI